MGLALRNTTARTFDMFVSLSDTGLGSSCSTIGAGDGTIWTASPNGYIVQWNLSTGQSVTSGNGSGHPITGWSGDTNIAFISSASMIVRGVGTSGAALFEISTGYSQKYATGTTAPNDQNKSQQIDADPINKIAVYGSGTNGQLCQFSGTTFTESVTSVSAFSSSQISVVLFAPTRGTFFIGTTTGVIFEWNANTKSIVGNVLTLPNSNGFVTSGAATQVQGMSYYNGMLLISTDWGVLYLYNWTNQTILDRKMFMTGSLNGSSTPLGPNVNGFLMLADAQPQSGTPICLLNFGASSIMTWDVSTIDLTSIHLTGTGVDASTRKAWMTFNSNTYLYVFDLDNCFETTTLATRAQYPVGTDIAFQSVRFYSRRIGTTWMDINQIVPYTVVGGVQQLQSLPAYKKSQYIEVAINTATNTWNVRSAST